MEHTKEPWVFRRERQGNRVRRFIRSSASRVGDIACAFSGTACGRNIRTEEAEANAHRIVDCVNALAGIENPAAYVAAMGGVLSELAAARCYVSQAHELTGDSLTQGKLERIDSVIATVRATMGDAALTNPPHAGKGVE